MADRPHRPPSAHQAHHHLSFLTPFTGKEFTGNRRDDRRVRAARETTPTPRSNQLRASNNELVFPPSSNSHMSNTLRVTRSISRATHTASNQRVNRNLIALNDRVLVPLAALTHSNMDLRTEVLERLE